MLKKETLLLRSEFDNLIIIILHKTLNMVRFNQTTKSLLKCVLVTWGAVSKISLVNDFSVPWAFHRLLYYNVVKYFVINVIFEQVHLQYDKLYVDGKCFVWNDHRGKVMKDELGIFVMLIRGRLMMMANMIDKKVTELSALDVDLGNERPGSVLDRSPSFYLHPFFNFSFFSHSLLYFLFHHLYCFSLSLFFPSFRSFQSLWIPSQLPNTTEAVVFF